MGARRAHAADNRFINLLNEMGRAADQVRDIGIHSADANRLIAEIKHQLSRFEHRWPERRAQHEKAAREGGLDASSEARAWDRASQTRIVAYFCCCWPGLSLLGLVSPWFCWGAGEGLLAGTGLLAGGVRPISYHSGRIHIEDTELLLRIRRHVGHVDDAAHERRPRLFGERLKRGEVPELPLRHVDLGHLMVEHPASQHGEPAALRLDEHLIGQCFSHGPVSSMSIRRKRQARARGHVGRAAM